MISLIILLLECSIYSLITSETQHYTVGETIVQKHIALGPSDPVEFRSLVSRVEIKELLQLKLKLKFFEIICG